MTTPTIRDHCAALAGDVAYLLMCVSDGSFDPVTLQEISDRADDARDALAAEAARGGPSAAEIDAAWLATWNPEANCYDVAAFAHAILAGWGHPATPPTPRPEGDWFTVALVAQDMRSRGLAEQACGEELLKLANSNRPQPARPAAPPAPEVDSRARELQRLLAVLLDFLCLPGHGVTEEDWIQACLLSGRYCEPFLSKSPAASASPEVGEGRWSEGVCGDGAAILFDGVMVPIEDVVRALNRTPANTARAAPPAPVVAPAGGLVERVAAVIHPSYPSFYRGEARAAIREVAAWLNERDTSIQNDPNCLEAPFTDEAIQWLREEAAR